MKKILIIICFGLIVISNSDAQIIRSYGLNAGYVYSVQNWNYEPSLGITGDWIKPRSGFTGGVFAEFLNDKNFSVLTKLQYVAKGRSITVMETRPDPASPYGYVDAGETTLRDRLDYITVPVLVKFRVETSNVAPFVAVGPRFESLAGHAISAIHDKFKKTEWTATFSAGTELSIGLLPKLMIEAEYNTSLTDSYKGATVTVNDHSFELLLGVMF